MEHSSKQSLGLSADPASYLSKQLPTKPAPNLSALIHRLNDSNNDVSAAIKRLHEDLSVFDAPANRINPNSYFKNNQDNSSGKMQCSESAPLQFSGDLAFLEEVYYRNQALLTQINEVAKHIHQISDFFDTNI